MAKPHLPTPELIDRIASTPCPHVARLMARKRGITRRRQAGVIIIIRHEGNRCDLPSLPASIPATASPSSPTTPSAA